MTEDGLVDWFPASVAGRELMLYLAYPAGRPGTREIKMWCSG